MNNSFWITTGQDHPFGDVIYSRLNQLRVRVTQLDQPAASDEVCIFGFSGDQILVFETIDIKPDDALDMIAAIQRYTAYIGRPHMTLSASL